MISGPKTSRPAAARFFIGVAAKSRQKWRDENTLPLFPLTMIMDAEGLLASDARHLVSGVGGQRYGARQ